MDTVLVLMENRLKVHGKLISRENAQLQVELYTNHIIHRNFQEIMKEFKEFFKHPSIYTNTPKKIIYTDMIELIETKMFLPHYFYYSYASGSKCDVCKAHNGDWYISNEKPVHYKKICSKCLPKKNPLQIIKDQNYEDKQLYKVLKTLLIKFDYAGNDILENFPNQYFEFYGTDLTVNLHLFEENKIILELSQLKGWEIIEAFRKTTLPKFETRMELLKTVIQKKNIPNSYPNYSTRFYKFIIKQEEMIEWCYLYPSQKIALEVLLEFCREY